MSKVRFLRRYVTFSVPYKEWENVLHAMSDSQLTFLLLCVLRFKVFVHSAKICWLSTVLYTDIGDIK